MSKAVAKRYALALFELAQNNNQIDSVEEEMVAVKSVFEQNEPFLELLQSPKLSRDEKKRLMNEAFNSASPIVLNTLKLLIDQKRQEHVIAVADQYIHLANEAKGVAEATVYSTKPLSEVEKIAVSATFAPKVGKKTLKIENKIDSNLIGGLKLRIGNRIFDGSIAGKLTRLERQLISTQS
ncbi:F0F1 ATP synthase subunit delta [Bacillus sp. 2205SS5-2]|uniref:F0F1 ATP synthase subunit delta n=1 Tax=Bacillus sp. 2205SS5-2 TaxID=3109031 RepID=UPI0030066B6F